MEGVRTRYRKTALQDASVMDWVRVSVRAEDRRFDAIDSRGPSCLSDSQVLAFAARDRDLALLSDGGARALVVNSLRTVYKVRRKAISCARSCGFSFKPNSCPGMALVF